MQDLKSGMWFLQTRKKRAYLFHPNPYPESYLELLTSTKSEFTKARHLQDAIFGKEFDRILLSPKIINSLQSHYRRPLYSLNFGNSRSNWNSTCSLINYYSGFKDDSLDCQPLVAPSVPPVQILESTDWSLSPLHPCSNIHHTSEQENRDAQVRLWPNCPDVTCFIVLSWINIHIAGSPKI